MDLEKQAEKAEKHPSVLREEKIARLTDELAPLEEIQLHGLVSHFEEPVSDYVDGSIIVDGSRLPTMKPFDDDDRRGIHPVVVVVMTLALSFVVFIAVLVSRMPEDESSLTDTHKPEPELGVPDPGVGAH